MRRDAAVSRARQCERSEATGLLRRFAPLNDGFCILCAALLLCFPALAAPRSIEDCEAIKEADAYNLCLASFGPTRAQKVKSYPGMAPKGDAAPKAARATPQRRISSFGGRITQRRGGRVHMEFTPTGR